MNRPSSYSRRDFLAISAAAGVGLMTANQASATEFKTKLSKSLIGVPSESLLTQWKAAGFEGIESTKRDASPDDAAAARKIADKLGMRIHSVLYGWANFNSPDTAQVAREIETVKTSLLAAEAYGADAVLLVPCRTGVGPIPEPWNFDIEIDEKTGHVKRVVKGDNSKFADYIAAQNQATDSSRAAVEKLIPVAEKAKVVIALENVWNNLWVKPGIFAHFVKSFKCPWVQTYFDIGNHVKYERPEAWIRALGKTIVKCHIKDFKLNADGHGGNFVHPRDGSIDWPGVRQALEEVGYNGWLTIEDGGLSLEEFNRRLDLIIAGK